MSESPGESAGEGRGEGCRGRGFAGFAGFAGLAVGDGATGMREGPGDAARADAGVRGPGEGAALGGVEAGAGGCLCCCCLGAGAAGLGWA